jgi:hypothetical protein
VPAGERDGEQSVVQLEVGDLDSGQTEGEQSGVEGGARGPEVTVDERVGAQHLGVQPGGGVNGVIGVDRGVLEDARRGGVELGADLAQPATSVFEYTATLNAVVNPNGAATKYYFEYGTTTSYGTKSAEVSAGSGTTNLEESLSGIELNPETTYDFRVVATNSNGTSDGENATFKTLAKGKAGKPQFVPAEGVKFPIVLESAKTGEWRMRASKFKASITCTSSKLKGEIAGPKTLLFTAELEGCILSLNGEKCTSKGLAEGHLLVDGEGKPVYLSKASKEVGTILTILQSFKCHNYTFIPEGGQIVALHPVNTKGSELKLAVAGNGDGIPIPGEYENEKG